MEGKFNHLCFNLLILIVFIAAVARSDDPDCVYTAYIRTGSIWKGGTDSKITLTIYDAAGYGLRIHNIEDWGGLMGPDHDYFERGNLDIFSGRGPCLTGPPCEMNLTSDGTGKGHGWYCNYVEVTTTGAHKPCAQQLFTVEQWLATDTSPYSLTAIVDNCGTAAVSSSSSNNVNRMIQGRREGGRHVIHDSGDSVVGDI